ncbi:MAG TPA: thiamine phosphate synthase [Nitrospirota bacterium]
MDQAQNEVVLAVDFNLYLITDRKQTRLSLPEAIRFALKGGVRAVQLREKDLPVRELLALARELRKITSEFKARLFVNDRVDVAVAADADGVHLGHQSMPVDAVRKVVGSRMLIGVSTHTANEALAAEKGGADFITFGPVFATPSKVPYGAPVGSDALRQVKERVRIPVFALGGIKQGNIPEVIQSGADGVALISAVIAAENIQTAAEYITRSLVSSRH